MDTWLVVYPNKTPCKVYYKFHCSGVCKLGILAKVPEMIAPIPPVLMQLNISFPLQSIISRTLDMEPFMARTARNINSSMRFQLHESALVCRRQWLSRYTWRLLFRLRWMYSR